MLGLYQDNFNIGTKVDNPTGDAFGRVRVSQPETMFYSALTYGLTNRAATTEIKNTGTGTTVAGNSGAVLSTAASGDASIMQTIQHFHYQPGKSQLIKLTGAFGSATTGTTKSCGYYDTNNGIFFSQSGAGVYSFTIRNGGSDGTPVTRDNWNINTLPGVDLTKAFILVIDLQWLGVGSVRVGFCHNGIVQYVHKFDHSGIVSTPYIATANLPIRYEIVQSGGTTGSFQAICAAVDSEGGTGEERAYQFGAGTGITSRAVTSALPVVALRPTLTFMSKVNRVQFIIDEVDITVSTNNALIQLVMHSSVSGGAFGDVNTGISAASINTTGTSSTGGIVIHQFTAVAGSGTTKVSTNQSGISSRIPLGLNIAGDTASYGFEIRATSYTGTSNVNAQVNWREVY